MSSRKGVKRMYFLGCLFGLGIAFLVLGLVALFKHYQLSVAIIAVASGLLFCCVAMYCYGVDMGESIKTEEVIQGLDGGSAFKLQMKVEWKNGQWLMSAIPGTTVPVVEIPEQRSGKDGAGRY